MTWFTVVIPSRDSAPWIGVLLQHYRAHGVVPIVLLDARTRDNSRAIAERSGARVVDITSFQFAEGLAALTRDIVATPWALFLNDDEIPSNALFARLASAPPTAAASVAISRRWARHVPGQPLQYGYSRHWPDRAGGSGWDHHWSLFRPRDVQFISAMHTDGFLIDRWCRLPLDEYVIHFEWVLRTRAQRKAKIARYDQWRPGFGSFFANMYLPEDQPDGVIRYETFNSNSYDRLAEAYFSARESRLEWAKSQMANRIGAILRRRGIPAPATSGADRDGLAPDPDKEMPYL